jgi:LysR family transcriptional regulator, glycine cleavage system transcriptional activator
MAQKLPPLTALRCLEVAARLESFSQAAEELHVTHSAVSHQIKALEEFLGVPLFVRQGRRIVLTDDGRFLAERVRSALAQIAEATASLGRRARPNQLTISVLPSFASRWLMPRIGRFIGEHPDWEVNIESNPGLADFVRDGVDVAIRFGRGPWPNVQTEWFMDDQYILVAGAKLNRGRLPTKLSDLTSAPLLRTDTEAWLRWCAEAGIQLPPPTGGVEFSDAAMNLQTVIDGRGIQLARRSIAAAEIAKGTLVQLFGVSVPAQESYFVVWPQHIAPSDKVLAFRDWLFKEKRRRK